jgi:beta-xylosidase
MDLKKYFPILGAILLFCSLARAEDVDLEFTLDAASSTIALPAVFYPAMDLSGRGFHGELTWPQALASREVIERWNKEIGFKGIYRLQYNLWEIGQLEKNRQLQEKLLANYESIIKAVCDSGSTVIVDIFSTPQGQGKVLDKKSSPVDLKVFKRLVKNYIRRLSCEKKYNIWYEVWTAPDLDIFFLGRQQEYLGLYKAVAESVKELESEYKIHIPLGGPSSSWWFRNAEGNTAISPERSLIYELIKFCCQHKLPLDFISWHAYSTDPKTEKEITVYGKSSVALIRDWLSYFNFPKDLPLIVDEWNYDSGENILAERKDKAYISASFIPARLRQMYEADIDHQLFFSLEDFQDNKEGVSRNVGVFWFESAESGYAGGNKAAYNVFRMLSMLGPDMYISPSKINDDFVGIVCTRSEKNIAILIYNYIDPDILRSFLSRNIATLGDGERKALLDIVRSEALEKIKRKETDVSALKAPGKVKNLLKKALEISDAAGRFADQPRELKLAVKNLKQDYLYARYSVNSACSLNCEMAPVEEKSVGFAEGAYSERLTLDPYSTQLIILKPKPEEQPIVPLAGGGGETGVSAQGAGNATEPESAQITNATSGK